MQKPSILFFIMLALLIGCGKTAPIIQANQLASPIPKSETEFTILDPDQLKAWDHFNKENRYRVARADDFKFPYSNKPSHPRHWFAFGDFNQDRRFSDFALIIVDSRQESESRFGVVIFNALEDGYDDPIWLYRGIDLSITSLNYSSHGPLLISKHVAEVTEVCTVKWNTAKNDYACN